MTVHILGGGGAIGSIVAYHLKASTSSQVSVLLRRSPSCQIRISLKPPGQPILEPQTVGCETSSGPGETISSLIVATKAYAIAPALAALSHRLTPQTSVLLLHNGLLTHPIETIVPVVSPRNVYIGFTMHCGYVKSQPPDLVTEYPASGYLRFGPAVEGGETDSTELARTLIGCEPLLAELMPHSDLVRAQRIKLAVNAAINPLSAVLNCTNGELFKHWAPSPVLSSLCEEISAVLTAERGGVKDEGFAPEALRLAAVRAGLATSANYQSMLQDVWKGNATEIDYINGAFSALGRRYRVATPLNDLLCQFVNLRTALGPIPPP